MKMGNRCSICGSRYKTLGYVSMLDGMVCDRCTKMYFNKTNDGIKAILYNKEELMSAIDKLGESGYYTLATALKDLQSKYTYFIDGYCIGSEEIIIYLRLKYKGKRTTTYVICDKHKAYYRIMNNKKVIEKTFASSGRSK